MHISIPEQSYPHTPVFVETQDKDGTPLAFRAVLTYRADDQCVVQAEDETWYCVPVEQVFPLQ